MSVLAIVDITRWASPSKFTRTRTRRGVADRVACITCRIATSELALRSKIQARTETSIRATMRSGILFARPDFIARRPSTRALTTRNGNEMTTLCDSIERAIRPSPQRRWVGNHLIGCVLNGIARALLRSAITDSVIAALDGGIGADRISTELTRPTRLTDAKSSRRQSVRSFKQLSETRPLDILLKFWSRTHRTSSLRDAEVDHVEVACIYRIHCIHNSCISRIARTLTRRGYALPSHYTLIDAIASHIEMEWVIGTQLGAVVSRRG